MATRSAFTHGRRMRIADGACAALLLTAGCATARLDASSRNTLDGIKSARVIKLGYRVAEVPVTKIYPPRAQGQTKMKPVTGWWGMLRPLVRVARESRKDKRA